MMTAANGTQGRIVTGVRGGLLAACLAVATAGPALAGDRESARERANEAVSLVERVEEIGHEVQFHTERLKRAEATKDRWWHYHHLNQIKGLINEDLRPAIVSLDAIRSELPDWKQGAVADMIAAAKLLAADTETAFFVKNTNPAVPPRANTEYAALVATMDSHAAALTKTADAAADLAAAHLKAVEAGLVAPVK